MKILDFIQKQSKSAIILLALIQIALIAYFDFTNGKEISIRLLYLIPLSMVAWRCNLSWGLIVALLAAAVKIYTDIILGITYSSGVIFVWEGLIEFGIFAAYVAALSKLKDALLSLEKKNDALKKANEVKNEFMIMAAHDLKNPLSNISGFASLINDEPELDKAEIKEMSARIIGLTERMFRLIDNLLGYNQNFSDKLNTEPETFDICTAAQSVLKQFNETAKAKNISLNYKNNGNNIPVFADFELTLQVLDNLVSNAIKFSPPNKKVFIGISQLTQVKKKSEKPKVRISIRDEGPGISVEDMKNLFLKFSKLSARPTAGESSTGMGLYIVKRFVEAMNGKVWCESKENNGAEFIVELPQLK